MELSEQFDEPENKVQFSPEQLDAIREAEACFERGEGMTAEEAHELARKRTAGYL